MPGVREVHNVGVLEVADRLEVSLHLKLPGIRRDHPEIVDVIVHTEP